MGAAIPLLKNTGPLSGSYFEPQWSLPFLWSKVTLHKPLLSSGTFLPGLRPRPHRASSAPHSPCLLATLPCIRSLGPAFSTLAAQPASCLILGPALCSGLSWPARGPLPGGNGTWGWRVSCCSSSRLQRAARPRRDSIWSQLRAHKMIDVAV